MSQSESYRGGKTRIPLRCYADVQNESNWLVKPEAAVAFVS